MGSKKCGECGHLASETARFCEQCGAALTPDGAPLRAPEPLARKILSERAGIEGERKQVTVMFTDIVGSMDLTRSLEEERWGIILDRFLAIASNAVHSFEGTVNQFTGDGLMAVFGAPLAHEDHARRACLAVLRLQRDTAELAEDLRRTDGTEFAIRCGLNSGEVIVGSIGDDLHMDFAPIGNTTALAKRMESLAPVGSTAISGSTAALVEGEFELRELGEFEVKGAGSQRVLELAGPGTAASRLEAVAATRGLSRFVGREREMEALDAALDAALKGDGRAIGIVGEPGVGKSRLVRVFAEACRERGTVVNSASAVAHGRFVPFLAALAMYRDYFGISDRDAPEAARGLIEEKLLALDSAFADDLPLLFDFLGVADPERPPPSLDPDARQRQLLDLVNRTINARSEHEPAVLILEDLHWMDDASAAFLGAVIETAPGTRTLLVTTYRPEYEGGWTHQEPHSEIALSPLDREATEALLGQLLGSDPSLDGLAELIEKRTGGNPFFIEEIVQTLAETGHLSGARGAYRLAAELEQLVLPPTVQAVLAARIDRLPKREKALMQTMSVIGKEVPAPLLNEVSDLAADDLAEAVTTLAGAELVIPQGSNGTSEYVFKHPLTQEVAYGSQLSERRARAHRTVAEAIERTYPDGLDERAALLAQHREAAGEKLNAARWHARAAAWAEVTSPADGMRHWRRVRELTQELDPSPEVEELATKARIGILGLAWRLGMSPEETAEIHAEGQERGSRVETPASPDDGATQEIGSPQKQILTDLNYAGTLAFGRQEREGLELGRRAAREGLSTGDIGLALSMTAHAYLEWIAGSLHEGLDLCDRALTLAHGDPTAGSGILFTCPLALAHATRGLCTGYLGDLAGAWFDFERSVELSREYNDPEVECYALQFRSYLEADIGEFGLASEHAAAALGLAEGIGEQVPTVRGSQAALAAAELGAGRLDEALKHAESGLALIRERDIGLDLEVIFVATLAEARLRQGDLDVASELAEEAVEIMEARGLATGALRAPLALAHALMTTEGAAAAERIESVLTRAMQVARESGARIFEPRIHRERAVLARLRGDEPSAMSEEAAAEAILAEIKSGRMADEVSTEQLGLDVNYCVTLIMGGREREGLEEVERITERVARSGDPGLELGMATVAARAHLVAGSVEKAAERLDRLLAEPSLDFSAWLQVGPSFGNFEAWALMMRGLCVGYMGRLGDALSALDRAAEALREDESSECQIYIQTSRAVVQAEAGELDGALKDSQAALDLAERLGQPLGAIAASTWRAVAEVAAGRFAEALATAEPTLERVRELGTGLYYEPVLLASTARAKLGLGEGDAARAAAEEGVEITEARGLTAVAIPARIALAQVLIATEGATAAERIEALLAGAIGAVRESGARIFEPQIHRELAALARLRGDESRAQHEDAHAERLAQAIRSGTLAGDEHSAERLRLDLNYAGTLLTGGQERSALDLLRALADEAFALGDPGLALTVAAPAAVIDWIAGSLREGIEIANRALGLAGEDATAGAGEFVKCPYALVLSMRGFSLGCAGDARRAREDINRALEIAREHDDAEVETAAHVHRSRLAAELGEPEEALEHAQRAIEAAARANTPYSNGLAKTQLAFAQAKAGHFADALASAEDALAEVREHGTPLYSEPALLAAIATARLGLGEPEAALTAAEEAFTIKEDRGLATCALNAPIALAQTLREFEGAAAAERIEAVLARAMEVAYESGARIFEPQIHQELAALARLRGDEASAEREQAEAERIRGEISAGAATDGLRSRDQILLDMQYAVTQMLGRREREALDLTRRVNEQAVRLGDPGLAVTSANPAGYTNWMAGSLREAVALADRSLAMAGDDHAVGSGLIFVCPYASLLATRGYYRGHMGEVEAAYADVERALTIAREQEDLEIESYTRGWRSILEANLGEAEAAIEDAEQALAVAKQAGHPMAPAFAETALAVAHATAGNHAEALEHAERTLATTRDLGTMFDHEAMLLATIAQAKLGLGEVGDALAPAEEAVAIMDERRLTVCALRAPIALAQVLIAAGDPAAGDRIEAVLARAMEVARDSGARIFEPQIYRERAALARLRGDDVAAEREEAEAERIALEIDPISDTRPAPSADQVLLDLNYSASLLFGGREREAIRIACDSCRRALVLGEPGPALIAAGFLAYQSWVAGSLAEAVEAADRALALAGDDHSAGSGAIVGCPYAFLLALRGLSAGFGGEIERGRRDFHRAIEIARDTEDAETECYAYAMLAWVEAEAGEGEIAIEHATEAYQRSLNLEGNMIAERGSLGALTAAELEIGDFARALEHAERGLVAATEKTGRDFEAWWLASIARAKLGLGESDAALDAAEQAVEIMEARGLTASALPAPIALAQILIATEGLAAAERIEQILARAMEVARESGARIFEPQIHRERAALARLRGDETTAEREDAQASRILGEITSGRAPQEGRSPEEILLDSQYWASPLFSGREREARERLCKVNEEALASGDAGLALTVAAGYQCAEWIAGSLREVLAAGDRAIELAGDDPRAGSGLIVTCPIALVKAYRALARGYMGDFAGARAEFEEATGLAREHRDVEVESYARSLHAWFAIAAGDADVALAQAELACEAGQRAGIPIGVVSAETGLAAGLAGAGDHETALQRAEQTLAEIRKAGHTVVHEPLLLAAVAQARLGIGDPEGALEAAEEAVELMEARGQTVIALAAPIVLAQALIATEGVAAADRVEEALGRALTIARECGARIFEPQIHRELAALARLRGDEGAADREEAAADHILGEIRSDRVPGEPRSVDQLLLDGYYANTLMFGGKEREGLERARKISREAIASGDAGSALTFVSATLAGESAAGTAHDAFDLLDGALELAGDDVTAGAGLVVPSPYAYVVSDRGFFKGYVGDLEAARADLNRAIEIARDAGDTEVESYIRVRHSYLQSAAGDSQAALENARIALELAESTGVTIAIVLANTALALAQASTGEFTEALERGERTLATMRETRTALHVEALLLVAIAKARHGLSQEEEAVSAAEEAVEVMEARQLTLLALPAPLTLARLLLELQGAAAEERVKTVLARALRVARESGARIFESQIQRELAELARSPGDEGLEQPSREQILLDQAYSGNLMLGGREREGLELARRAYRAALATRDPDLVMSTAVGLTPATFFAGSLDEMAEVAEGALGLAGSDEAAGAGTVFTNPYSVVHSARGVVAAYRDGDRAAAERHAARAIAIAAEHGDVEAESYLNSGLACWQADSGEATAALESAERAVELAQRSQVTLAAGYAGAAMAFAQAIAGNFSDALKVGEKTLSVLREAGTGLVWEPRLLTAIAKARLGLGDSEGALAAAEEAVEIMEAHQLTVVALPAPIALAQILLVTEGAAAAERIEAVLGRAREVARESGARLFEPEIDRLLAELERLRGDATPPSTDQILLDQNYGGTLLLGGRESEGLELLRKASQAARTLGDPGLVLTTACGEALARYIADDARDGFQAVDSALALAGDDDRAGAGILLSCPYGMALAQRGLCAGFGGDLKRAYDDLERAIGITRERGDPESEGQAYIGRAALNATLGEIESARADAERAVEISHATGNTLLAGVAAATLAYAEASGGDFAGALGRAETALEEARQAGIALHMEPFLLGIVAVARLGSGDSEEALAAAEEAVEIMDTRGLTLVALAAPITLAQVLLATEGAAAAERVEAVLSRAKAVAEDSGGLIFMSRIHDLFAELARLRGDEAAAKRETGEAARILATLEQEQPPRSERSA